MVKACILLCACLIAVFLEVTASPLPSELTEEQKTSLYGNSENYQGDIKLTDEQKQEIESNTGMLNTARRWPMNVNRQVIVPYRIEARHGFSKRRLKTCSLQFVSRLFP
jgi:hypothetical protein